MISRHPFHSICPYFAMFPEQFVEQQLLTYTSPGDLVFDPFCGRGTTVFESLLRDRRAAGSDINPVAACIAKAKATAPVLSRLLSRLDILEQQCRDTSTEAVPPTPFFSACFHADTLSQLLFVRSQLKWKRSATDCFLSAVILGILHGESHRTDLCLSNRMPRTISTKPEYSIRWWNERGLAAPFRDVFSKLRKAVAFRYRLPPAQSKGRVSHCDARKVCTEFAELKGAVKLVVTSPPYLDTTDYSEDQWLRLWFLGGRPYPEIRKNKDDRYTNLADYWKFLEESWRGIAPLLADESTVVIRIGGAKLTKRELLDGLTVSLQNGMKTRGIRSLHAGVTSTIRPRETSAFRPTRRAANVEHDFVFRLN